MSRCLACGDPVPDVPSTVPLRYCTQKCRERVEAAAVRFLAALAQPESSGPDDEEGPVT